MVSACHSFYRSSSVHSLRLGGNLTSDQPLSPTGPAPGYAGGGGCICRVKIHRGGGVPNSGHSPAPVTFLPAGRPLGYRHINRFPAYERVDSLQPSHFPYTATSVRSNPSGCVARCVVCSQRYQFPSGNGYFVHASLCSKLYPRNI